MRSKKRPHLASDQKLAALRAGDPFRKWNSLDDRRVCVLCDRTITGRQIEVSMNGTSQPHLTCPTPDCNAGPHEWVHPGNPLTSEKAWRDWSRIFDEGPDIESGTVARYLQFRQSAA
jgi:hypothetical protein